MTLYCRHNTQVIISPNDTTDVIWYFIWLCDMDVTSYHTVLIFAVMVIESTFEIGCIINTELPSCDDVFGRTSLGFPSWCPESIWPMDSCFQDTSWDTS